MSTDELEVHVNEASLGGDFEPPPVQMTDILNKVLADLHRASTDIVQSMVASRDGLAMITHGTMDNEDHAAAICAELMNLCQQAAADFSIGTVNLFLARAQDGYALVLPVSDEVMLAMITRSRANIGFLLLEGERAAAALAAAL
jgi:predicted regulator of Ras-like GTPase activity (Roadblock/LC7/MglB family)